MPIIVIKDYNWRQTQDCVIIQVNIIIAPKTVDLMVVDNYMKAHFKPFIIELFLWGSVKDENSICVISDREINFTLKKASDIEWPSLETMDLTKEIKEERRNLALKLAQNVNEEKSKKKLEKLHNLRRQATQAQMNLNTNTINKINNIKDSICKTTINDLNEWSKNIDTHIADFEIHNIQNKGMSVGNKLQNIIQDSKNENESLKKDKIDNITENFNNIWDGFDTDEEENKTHNAVQKKNNPKYLSKNKSISSNYIGYDSSIPLPRNYGKINVTFSERVFVTPARESFKDQEEEWLTKQAKARRNTGFVAEDLRSEEQDPQWCLDKGEDFMKVANYFGAISAFSHGIKLNDKIETLYIARSAAHYACGNYHKCIEDATKAIELMVPECEANRESRARCYARRGAALCQLSAPQHGLPEMEAALKLMPHDIQIQTDIHQIKNYFNLN